MEQQIKQLEYLLEENNKSIRENTNAVTELNKLLALSIRLLADLKQEKTQEDLESVESQESSKENSAEAIDYFIR